MGKIFVRQRRNVKKGAKKPRFAVVAVSDLNLKVYHSHIRRGELERLAEELEAEIVELPRGRNKPQEPVDGKQEAPETPKKAKSSRKARSSKQSEPPAE
jgi:hypothetical protein